MHAPHTYSTQYKHTQAHTYIYTHVCHTQYTQPHTTANIHKPIHTCTPHRIQTYTNTHMHTHTYNTPIYTTHNRAYTSTYMHTHIQYIQHTIQAYTSTHKQCTQHIIQTYSIHTTHDTSILKHTHVYNTHTPYTTNNTNIHKHIHEYTHIDYIQHTVQATQSTPHTHTGIGKIQIKTVAEREKGLKGTRGRTGCLEQRLRRKPAHLYGTMKSKSN